MKKSELIAVMMVAGLAILGCERMRGGQMVEPIQPKELTAVAEQGEVKADTSKDENSSQPVEEGPEIRSAAETQGTAVAEPRTVVRPSEAIGAAVLVVNRDNITAEDVIRRIRPELESIAATYNENVYERRAEGLIGQATRDLVSETLLYRQVSERISEEQSPVIDKVVEKEVTRLANQEAGGSMVRLEVMLREQGSTLEILRDQLRKQIVTQQYLREAMKPKVAVTRKEMWTFYQEHMDEFCEPEQVHLLLIEVDAETFLPKDFTWQTASSDQKRSAQTQTDARIAEASAKLKAGEDFGEVAKTCSTGAAGRLGGKLGWISRGSYRLKELEDKAFGLEAGVVSEPMTLGAKTYLLKVSERKAGKTTSFCEAQAKVKGELEQQIYRRLVMEHLAKLWSKSQIGELEPFMQTVHSRLPAYEAMREKALGKTKEK
jgi:parvulin-like peptidyl-prolyl isomerase